MGAGAWSPAGFQPGSIAPQPLEVIAFAGIRAHDVNHDVQVIQDNPGGGKTSVDGAWSEVVLFPEFVGDFVDDCAEVGFA